MDTDGYGFYQDKTIPKLHVSLMHFYYSLNFSKCDGGGVVKHVR